MKLDDCFLLGHITKTHGTKGEVVAFFDVDFPEDYEELESVFLLTGGKLVPFFIEGISMQQKGKFIIAFEDVNTVADADKLKGVELYLPLTALPELEHDQFYFHEVIGYRVHDAEAGELGTVRDIYAMPTQDLIAMEYEGAEVLIPIMDDIVLRVDREARVLHVALPEGLLEVYTTNTAPDDLDEEGETEEEENNPKG